MVNLTLFAIDAAINTSFDADIGSSSASFNVSGFLVYYSIPEIEKWRRWKTAMGQLSVVVGSGNVCALPCLIDSLVAKWVTVSFCIVLALYNIFYRIKNPKNLEEVTAVNSNV